MKQELKIRIKNYTQIEKKLLELGATFLKETSFVDTYFNAPKGKVLKIVENNNEAFLVKFAENNGKFDVVGREKIDNLKTNIKQLTSAYGINRILKGTRKEYEYNGLKITFNLIDALGEFLIITGENSQDGFIKNILLIQDPDYITVPFNEL